MNDKRARRAELRERRRAIVDASARSTQIATALCELEALGRARDVLAYEAVPGEPDLTAVIEWCRARGVRVECPKPSRDAAQPPEPGAIDVVLVPGLAFTAAGDRLGQGGGWYDRLLATLGAGCVTIGVCFDAQIVDMVPTEPHDRPVDLVVTERGIVGGRTSLTS